MKKNVLLSLILLFLFITVKGQDDPYRAEIGVQAGVMSYFGDVNTVADPTNLLRNVSNITGETGLMFRYRFNKRLAMRAGYDYLRVKGDFQYRDGNESYHVLLNNPMHNFDLWGEFNFFDLENNPHKVFSKPYSPFIFAGVGWVALPGNQLMKSSVVPSLPFGVGFKWKVSDRLNFNMQLTNRLALSDALEGVPAWDNPLPKTQNNLMNNDFTSALTVGFSYDFWTRGCDCKESTFSSGKRPVAQKVLRQREKGERKKEPRKKL